jgi:hypothetical protein
MEMKTNLIKFIVVSIVDPLCKLLEDSLDVCFELVFRQIIELGTGVYIELSRS